MADPTLPTETPDEISEYGAYDFHTHDGVNSQFIDVKANGITIIPSQAGNAGKFLTTDGTNLSFGSIVIPPQTYNDFLGDGSDGGVVFDGSTTILGFVPSSSIYTMTRDIFCTSITINSGVTVKQNGYQIFCQGILTINGNIQRNGNNGGNGGNGGNAVGNNSTGTLGTAGTAGSALPAGSLPIAVAGAVGGQGQGSSLAFSNGANGTNIAYSLAGTALNAVNGGAAGTGAISGIPVQPTGTHGTAGLISASTTASVHLLKTFVNLFDANGAFLGIPSGSGGGGANGGENNQSASVSATGGGGGGGGSASPGGMMMIFALGIIIGIAGSITSIGGNGGTGGNGGNASGASFNQAGGGGGGGAPGNGGIIGLIYHTLTNNGLISVAAGTIGVGGTLGSGGTGGTASSNGVTGVAGLIFQFQF